VNEMWNEAIEACDGTALNEKLACLVSIGTGVPNLKKFGERAKDVVGSIVRIATETESTANTFQRSHPELTTIGQQRYFRFNVTGGLGEIGLDEASQAGAIEDITDIYLKDDTTFKQIRLCAKVLAEKKIGMTREAQNSYSF
jgi:hypothetical protein